MHKDKVIRTTLALTMDKKGDKQDKIVNLLEKNNA